MFYKKGDFKFNFLYFDKKNPHLYPQKKNERKKFSLKATVAVNNILETGILIILSPTFRDIQKLWSV